VRARRPLDAHRRGNGPVELAGFGRVTPGRLPVVYHGAMHSRHRLLLAGWLIAIAGLALVVWQAAQGGGGSDRLFNIGVVALIVGNVLRVYARYSPRKPRRRPVDPGAEKSDESK
jgi:hypothetical protein